MKGHFVISLDYEIHWGVFDKRTVEEYKENLSNVGKVIDRLLALSDKYNVKITFSTVGFLFAKDKKELFDYIPINKPTYLNEKLSPYPLLDGIGNNENDDPFHYGLSGVNKIQNNGNHEIGTHTYCHYYCHIPGQTIEQFDDDINSAVSIAKSKGIEVKSLVFPRNMIDAHKPSDKPLLNVLNKHGITSFRGKENSFIYNIHTTKFYKNWFILKLLKFLDAYISITGPNTYDVIKINKSSKVINLPSSRLLRAYSYKFRMFEPFKLKRIKRAMTHAAKKNEMFHLWWHPHNFGAQTDENFSTLEEVFKTYKSLNETYGFQSETMTGLTNKIKATQ
ncbi:polysaccharide deacetylase family protein [Psychroserpens jangbogonensis]|uniref:polysaccharide deacetylase family protein n=1 Tax=Psychroserpens jangbogonensis TaxID=1484460 RepID=UPI00053EB70D|nr:polysaccharide deacetylase family protein [Psychroserpens jangbogonensis]